MCKLPVLLLISLSFRAVVWVVLLCKIIVDRRFRGAYCLHHQGWVSRGTEGSRIYRCPVTRWTVVVGDDRLGTGQWEWAGGGSSREWEVYRQEDVKWMQRSPWKGLVEGREGINVVGRWRRVRRRAELSWERQMYQVLLYGGAFYVFSGSG
jgi:hypothetical protein